MHLTYNRWRVLPSTHAPDLQRPSQARQSMLMMIRRPFRPGAGQSRDCDMYCVLICKAIDRAYSKQAVQGDAQALCTLPYTAEYRTKSQAILHTSHTYLLLYSPAMLHIPYATPMLYAYTYVSLPCSPLSRCSALVYAPASCSPHTRSTQCSSTSLKSSSKTARDPLACLLRTPPLSAFLAFHCLPLTPPDLPRLIH